MNYEKLMDFKPTVLNTFINSKGQSIDLVEHPIKGVSYPVIAVFHPLKEAITTDFYKTGDIMADHRDHEVVFDDTRYPRLCEVTNKGISKGWIVNEGDLYIGDEHNALKHAKANGFESLQEAYDEDFMYFTEWEDIDSEIEEQGYYYTSKGRKIEI